MILDANKSFQPIRITEVELSQPLPTLSAIRQAGEPRYGTAKLVIRLHDSVIGMVDVPFRQEVLRPADYVSQIWDSLREEINAHLLADNLSEVEDLTPDGVETMGTPLCTQKRVELLAQAPMVSVIVCSHNRTEFLKTCLPALTKLSYPNYEVIVVDNAPSSSETHDFIRDHYGASPDIRYVREDQAGLSWARNCGLRHARGEIVAFTDDDAVADRHWLTQLIKNFYVMDNVVCVTGLALPLELESQSQVWFEQFGGLGNGFNRLVFDTDEHRRDSPLYPYTVGQYGAGVNMAYRVKELRDMGGFEVRLNQADDISMFVKMITNGYRIIYDPDALIYHKHRQDYEGLRRQIHNYGIGLTMFLTYMATTDWRWLFKVALKIPAGMMHILNPHSYKNEHKRAEYPAELTWLERKGMLQGPFRYFRYALQIRGLRSNVEPEN